MASISRKFSVILFTLTSAAVNFLIYMKLKLKFISKYPSSLVPESLVSILKAPFLCWTVTVIIQIFRIYLLIFDKNFGDFCCEK